VSTSTIEWTEHTWNPVTGCSKVSPGCAHCYAETVALRFWPTQYQAITTNEANRAGTLIATDRPREFTDVQCHADRLDQPLRRKNPTTYFVNSMSDLFHEDVPDAFIDRVFAVMALAPRHTFQVLTKRAERMREYAARLRPERLEEAAHGLPKLTWNDLRNYRYPFPNVWLGVSVESQHFADERIPLLLKTPAAVRFISAEPLLGSVDLACYLDAAPNECSKAWCEHGFLDWVIVGGESGHGARPFDVAWARSIVAQCRAAGVAVFVKQLGAKAGVVCSDSGRLEVYDPPLPGKGGEMIHWPADLRIREFPEVTR
jgi:protein gp37